MKVSYSGYGKWVSYEQDDKTQIIIYSSKISRVRGIFELPEESIKDIEYNGETFTDELLPCTNHKDAVKAPTSENYYQGTSQLCFVLLNDNNSDNKETYIKEYNTTDIVGTLGIGKQKAKKGIQLNLKQVLKRD